MAKMARTCGMLAAAALVSAAWAWTDTLATTTSTRPAEVKLSRQQLVKQIQEKANALPNSLKYTPTAAQEATAIEACKLFKTAQERLAELNRDDREWLGRLGIRAGAGAGDPQVMLAGVKLYEKAKDKPSDYTGSALVWAGLFAGDTAAARRGLEQLSLSTKDSWRSWAKRMAPAVAQAAKPITLRFRLMDRKTVNLNAHRGKVIVLHFWASCCGPSMRELPNVSSFYEKRKGDKSFTMISFSLDDNVGAAKKVIRSHSMVWPQAMDNKTFRQFAGKGIPYAVVIGPTGRAIWQGHPGSQETFHWVVDFARRQATRLAESRPAEAAKADKPIAKSDVETAKTPTSKPASKRPAADTDTIARGRYKLGMMYLNAGMKDKAKVLFEEVLAKYPKTPAAAEAAKALKDM